jgi:hypothetical protein
MRLFNLWNKIPTFQVSITNITGIKENMNTIAVIILNLVFLFNAFICNEAVKQEKDSDPLPGARPEKFAVSYFLGGGMRYYGETLYISADSCTYEINDEGAKSKIYFNLSSDELDKLYKVFKDNDFHKIKTYDQEVYDRGGVSISLSWGNGKSANVSDGGMTFIKENWKNEWSACISALKDIISTQLGKQKKDYEIRIDKTFFGKTMNIYVKSEVVIPKSTVMAESEMEKYVTKTIKLIPGEHVMSISWDTKHYETVHISPDSSKGITLYLGNDSLKTSLIKE